MNNSKKEDGYVLVVIIGILTILSLMTITFATLSRIEIRATRNYTDSVRCEMVAKAGLEHALYIIRYDKFGSNDVAYDEYNSEGDTNYDLTGDNSWPGNTVFPGSDYDNDGVNGVDSKWIYFPATTSSSDIRLPGNLRARYAVLITDDREARVNINVTGNKAGGGSHTSNEGWSTFEIDLSDLIEREVGNGTTIANLIIDARHGTDTLPGTTGDDDLGKIPDPQYDGIDNDGDFTADEAGEGTDGPSEFNSISPLGDDVPFGLLAEAEIMSTSTYTSRLETIFNNNSVSADDQDSLNSWLTTYSADTIVCPPYPLGTSTSTTMLNINALINNEGAYTGAYYTPDKKVAMLIDALAAGGVPDVERQQMAVNILDFMDTNGTVSNYLTYYGIEETPYINEVEANPSGSGSLFIELFNPYNTAIPIGNWTITGTTMPTVTITPNVQILAQGYYLIDNDGGAGANQTNAGVGSLTSTGETLTLKDSNDVTVQVTYYGSANNPQTRQLNDPRPPWNWASSNPTPGAPNNNFNPSVGADGWALATWTSSFYVANKNRFPNKGHLGYIHRGSDWSCFKFDGTNNNVYGHITITDPSMDNIDNDGDGSADSADTGAQSGDIDGPEYRIPGLINVNNASVAVLESLPDITNGIANAIFVGSKPYSSIGNLVVKVPDITNTGATKWDREKPLRSISNLITTRSNVFTVYITAQITNEAETSVFAEKRILAIIDRAVDPIKIRYFRWITEW